MIQGILETSLYTRDLDAAVAFYGGVLGLELIARAPERHIFYRCGNAVLLVFNPDHTSLEQTTVNGARIPLHGARGEGHVAFRVAEQQFDACREHLVRHGVAIESEVRWPHGGRSLYVRDPARNSVEFATPDLWER
jgi:catechol 2,3-dioxygenase-like lactoylglutathione lyase family enzyme